MTNPAATLWFDFVDPLSYLQHLELRALAIPVAYVGLEIAPPPTPMAATTDPAWVARLDHARPLAAAAGVALAPPALVPWTRKAHELHLHAQELGRADDVRSALFDAYFGRGEDIGRIDRLVAIAEACGLEALAARTVLGVGRHEDALLGARADAAAAGVREVPALVVGGRVHRGFHNRTALGTLLR